LVVGIPKTHHPGSRERCRFAIQPSELSEAQLDHICASDFPSVALEALLERKEPLEPWQDPWGTFPLEEHQIEALHTGPVDGGGARPFNFRLFTDSEQRLVVGSGLREVFPEYAQWRQHFLDEEFEKSNFAAIHYEARSAARRKVRDAPSTEEWKAKLNGGASIRGGSAEESWLVKRTMSRYHGLVETCFQRMFKNNSGRVVQVGGSFEILTDGTLSSPRIEGAMRIEDLDPTEEARNPELEGCILKVVRRIKFEPWLREDVGVGDYAFRVVPE